MDFLYIMPMPLDILTMLALSLELITDMDMLLDMVQLETVAMLPMAIMVLDTEELGLFTVKDKKNLIQDRISHGCEYININEY